MGLPVAQCKVLREVILAFVRAYPNRAKLFTNGRSQASRLPKAFRFDGVTEVLIEREGKRVILSPGKRAPIEQLIAALDEFEFFPEREQPATDDQREAC